MRAPTEAEVRQAMADGKVSFHVHRANGVPESAITQEMMHDIIERNMDCFTHPEEHAVPLSEICSLLGVKQ